MTSRCGKRRDVESGKERNEGKLMEMMGIEKKRDNGGSKEEKKVRCRPQDN